MPRSGSKLWNIECTDEGCRGCKKRSDTNPRYKTCTKLGGQIIFAEVNRSAGDATFSMSKRMGMRWLPGVRSKIMKRQTKAGKVICGICHKPIKFHRDKKIRYVSKSGKEHIESPPIDHYNDDWIVRLRRLETKSAFIQASLTRQHQLKLAIYNAEPLRITCRSCNLGRPKC
ncbi:MAG: hypothetical protein AAFQ66_22855 [Pseudomonadota bacterium]